MPRAPKYPYSLHKGSGQACVRVNGRVHYLGKYGSHESRVRHQRLVAEALAGRALVASSRPLSVGEVCERFVGSKRDEHGDRSWQHIQARMVALAVCERFAGLEASAFGPKALQEVVQSLLAEAKLTRGGINRRKQQVVAMFKWAVSEELVPASAWHALQSVRGLRYGKGRDNPLRVAAEPAAVEAVIQHLREHGNLGAARCVAFIRATGCRPAEATGALPVDFRMGGPTPLLVVQQHKCAHRGMERVIPLNAAAAAVVREALADRATTHDLVFPNSAGNRWDNRTFPRIVARACEALGIPKWTPYQLRHLAATEAVNRTGSEAATAALLGHAPDSTIVRRYSRNRLALAEVAARAVGA
jgi:integrase